jgi:hypothetical protein
MTLHLPSQNPGPANGDSLQASGTAHLTEQPFEGDHDRGPDTAQHGQDDRSPGPKNQRIFRSIKLVGDALAGDAIIPRSQGGYVEATEIDEIAAEHDKELGHQLLLGPNARARSVVPCGGVIRKGQARRSSQPHAQGIEGRNEQRERG